MPDATGKRRCVGTYADEAEARATLRAALERLAEGVRALLIEVFARCGTAAAACDELGMRRTARGDAMVAPVSALRRAAQRAGVPWPYTARGRPDLRRA